MKQCSKCKNTKDGEEFYLWSGKLSGICKACNRERANKWQKDNQQRYTDRQTIYREENVDKLKEYARERYIVNKDVCKRRVAKWKVENKARVASTNAKRRAIKKAAIFTPPDDEFNQLFIIEAYDLAKRRTATLGTVWHVDHTVPLKSKSVCGLHWYGNIQVVTAAYNLRKGNNEWEHKW